MMTAPPMNLTTEYLGLKLRSPLVVGASPFCDDTFVARRLQDAGAGAVVMRSLFAEQLEPPPPFSRPPPELISGTEAPSTYPEQAEYQLSEAAYLEQLGSLRANLAIPIIASIGGTRPGGWTDVARRLESAGASAIELNLYHVVADPEVSGDEIEARMLETVADVDGSVQIPVAVKISPFHTALAQFAGSLARVGASGIVLFNRFYQPDVVPDEMETQPVLRLSDPHELLLRLRWLAILSPKARYSLSAGGGIHSANDAIKALLTGADTVQVVSVLLKHGPHFLSTLNTGIGEWMAARGYTDLADFRGVMNLAHAPSAPDFERANYIRILQRWKI